MSWKLHNDRPHVNAANVFESHASQRAQPPIDAQIYSQQPANAVSSHLGSTYRAPENRPTRPNGPPPLWAHRSVRNQSPLTLQESRDPDGRRNAVHGSRYNQQTPANGAPTQAKSSGHGSRIRGGNGGYDQSGRPIESRGNVQNAAKQHKQPSTGHAVANPFSGFLKLVRNEIKRQDQKKLERFNREAYEDPRYYGDNPNWGDAHA